MSMIRLNLLPLDEKGRRTVAASRAPSMGSGRPPSSGTSPTVYLVLFPAFAVALGVAGYIYNSEILEPQRRGDELEERHDALAAEVAELEVQYAGLRETYELYSRQARVIDILMPSNRILWSEKFNQISQCVPDNVYLTRITMDEEVNEFEAPESIEARAAWEALPEDERGDEPIPLMIPSIIQTLGVEGIAFAEQTDRRIRLVLAFRDNLLDYSDVDNQGRMRHFREHFAGQPHIDYNRIRDVAGVTVNEFRLVLRTHDLAQLAQSDNT